MNKSPITTIIFLILLFYVAGVALASNKLDSFQVWQADHVEYSSEKWDIVFGQEMRFGSDAGFYRQHTDVEFTSKITKWFNVIMAYKQIYERDSNLWDKWTVEYRPDLRAEVVLNWQNIDLSSLHRIEYRVRDRKDNEWRYRTSLKISPAVGWTKYNIKPYLSDEIVLDFYGDGLARNRVYGGINVAPMKFLKCNVYYLFQATKTSDKWPTQNILGVNFKVAF